MPRGRGLISKETPSTTVIIPTTAVTSRRASLLNAIHSAGEQSGVATKILVVVNGQRFDPTLLNELRSRKDIKVRRCQSRIFRGSLRGPATRRHRVFLLS